MRLWTWLEMKTKIENDLDLQCEETVSPEEMLGYANDGIDEAESVIHNLNEDYFFTKDQITLAVGQSVYDMPSDIYAQKIRGLVFDNGTETYPVRRIKLEKVAYVRSEDPYCWLPTNKVNDGVVTDYGPKIELVPASRDAGAYITRYYIRNAKRLTADTDECDIPEFTAFVIAFVKVQAAIKEMHPRLEFFQGELERLRAQMTVTLTEMTPDGDNWIEPDMSHYLEHN